MIGQRRLLIFRLVKQCRRQFFRSQGFHPVRMIHHISGLLRFGKFYQIRRIHSAKSIDIIQNISIRQFQQAAVQIIQKIIGRMKLFFGKTVRKMNDIGAQIPQILLR